MYPLLFQIGGYRVASYGVSFVLAVALGYLLARRQGRVEGFSLDAVESLWMWAIGASMIGGRALFLLENAGRYARDPRAVLAVDAGGFSALGSFYATVAVVALWSWRRKLSFWKAGDVIAPGLALALGVGKVGCFLAGCCNGTPSTLPWAVTFTHPLSLADPKGIPLHPVQLYEAFAWGALASLLVALRARRRFPGEVGLVFFLGFGVARGALELFRANSVFVGPFTTYQWLCIPLAVASGALTWYLRRRHPLRSPGAHVG